MTHIRGDHAVEGRIGGAPPGHRVGRLQAPVLAGFGERIGGAPTKEACISCPAFAQIRRHPARRPPPDRGKSQAKARSRAPYPPPRRVAARKPLQEEMKATACSFSWAKAASAVSFGAQAPRAIASKARHGGFRRWPGSMRTGTAPRRLEMKSLEIVAETIGQTFANVLEIGESRVEDLALERPYARIVHHRRSRQVSAAAERIRCPVSAELSGNASHRYKRGRGSDDPTGSMGLCARGPTETAYGAD